MPNKTPLLSPIKRRQLTAQGYGCYTDQQLLDYKFGIRFAYYLCGLLVLIGLILANLKILAIAMIIAFLGSLPPYHPFDYLYNYVIRHWLKKPKMPPRTNQGRFACGIATVWIGGIIFLFYSGLDLFAYIAGGILLLIATLVSTTDICIPSMIYNFLFLKGRITNK